MIPDDSSEKPEQTQQTVDAIVLGADKKQLTIPQTEISANGGDYMNDMNGGHTNQNRDQHDTKED